MSTTTCSRQRSSAMDDSQQIQESCEHQKQDKVDEMAKNLKHRQTGLVDGQMNETTNPSVNENMIQVLKCSFSIPSINVTKSRKVFGIEFAPLIMPLERRLQTLAVFHLWIVTLVSVFSIPLGLYVLMFTNYSFLVVFYVGWLVLYDWKTPEMGGRRSTIFRNSTLWNYFRDYFPISLHKTGELSPKENYIFGYHPHGLATVGALCNFGSEATQFSKLFPGIKCFLVGLNFFFNFPILRDYFMACGFCKVSRKSIHWLTTKNGEGNAVVIVVGGVEEALETRPDNFELVLRKRKGFCRMALQSGSHLVPCYSFGENETLYQLGNSKGSNVRKFQNIFRKIFFGFPPIVVYGRGMFNYNFGYMPFRKPINVVVGKPIVVSKVENPTLEEVDNLHSIYIEALFQLFNDHKEKYGVTKETQLQFI